MNAHLPDPVCKAFLVCRQVSVDPRSGECLLVGLPMGHTHHRFPCAAMVGFFARLADARGDSLLEVQLIDGEGAVVWRDGPPDPVPMPDPLVYYDFRLNLNVVFPAPGDHQFVLAVDGRPVAAQRFRVSLPDPNA